MPIAFSEAALVHCCAMPSKPSSLRVATSKKRSMQTMFLSLMRSIVPGYVSRNRPKIMDVARLASAALVALSLGLLAACGNSDSSSTSAVPPAIALQPSSATAQAGTNAAFTVSATGDGLTFQWQRSTDNGATFIAIAGANAATLTLTAVDVTLNATQYDVVITGTAGAVTSSAVTLTVTPVPIAPAFTMQPSDQTVVAGLDATFSVTATGTSIVYQWQTSLDDLNWTNIAGANAPTLVLPAVALTDSGKFVRAVIFNAITAIPSSVVRLTVTPAPVVPAIATQPAAVLVVAPSPGTFTVVASGVPAPTFQWQVSTDGGVTFVNVAGATNASFATPATTVADSGKLYRVNVTNTAGTVVSNSALLAVSSTAGAPAISLQPASVSVVAPATATFTAGASGAPTPTFQWQVSTDGGVTFTNVNGATAASFTTSATTTGDNGKQFRLVATNSAGSAISNAATLTVH
jgi:hypothetical protein